MGIKQTKLHLGCGGRKFDGYVNIDIRKTPCTDKICDVSKLDYPANSVDEIYSSHLFEHLDAEKALNNWYKILKPGGKLIIEVPDCEYVIDQIYVKEDRPFEDLLIFLYGKKDPVQMRHTWGYSRKTLREIVERYKFKVTHIGCQEADGRTPEYGIRLEAIK